VTAPAQLVLAPPGYCVACQVIRLSVADKGNLCMFCVEAGEILARYVRPQGKQTRYANKRYQDKQTQEPA
jgi:hypothetical protein